MSNWGRANLKVEQEIQTHAGGKNPLAKYAAITAVLTAVDFTNFVVLRWFCAGQNLLYVLPHWLYDIEWLALMSINALVPLSLITLLGATIWSGRLSPIPCEIAWPRSLNLAWCLFVYNLSIVGLYASRLCVPATIR